MAADAASTAARRVLEALDQRLAALEREPLTADARRASRQLLRLMPPGPDDFVRSCDALMESGRWLAFWLVTAFIKARGDLYRHRYLDSYRNWLQTHATGWGRCDVLCYRVLNPMVEAFRPVLEETRCWARSRLVYVRRAAAVSLIRSGGRGFVVAVAPDHVFEICQLLRADHEPHVQKGIGWLLKYAYLSYPEPVVGYLEANVRQLSRTSFRYALEKMDPQLRARLMNL